MAVGAIAPLALNVLRWILAGLILLPFAWRSLWLHRATIKAEWPWIALTGALGVGSYNSLQYEALQTSTPINVTLIASSGPVFILAVGALMYGEKISRRQLIGAGLSIFGVLWVMLRGDPGRIAHIDLVRGDLFMLAAALTWSFYTWLLRKRRPNLPLPAFLWLQMLFGVLALAPLAAIEAWYGVRPTVWSGSTLAIIGFVALMPSLVAYFCWDRGVARAGAQLPMYFANLTPVFAALISALLLREMPQLYHVVGLMLILAGIRLASR